MTAPTSC